MAGEAAAFDELPVHLQLRQVQEVLAVVHRQRLGRAQDTSHRGAHEDIRLDVSTAVLALQALAGLAPQGRQQVGEHAIGGTAIAAQHAVDELRELVVGVVRDTSPPCRGPRRAGRPSLTEHPRHLARCPTSRHHSHRRPTICMAERWCCSSA
jgi:hypothetical protein